MANAKPPPPPPAKKKLPPKKGPTPPPIPSKGAVKAARALAPPKPAVPPPVSTRTVKKFAVSEWSGDKEGEKIIVYAKHGMGKTTLSALAPKPVFIGIDDGGRKIKDPRTGEDLKHIPDVEDFQDVRDVLHQHEVFDDCETIVIDTVTALQHMGLDYTFLTVKGPKNLKCTNIEQYGYHKGYRHLYDTMHHILGDLDPLVKRGKNVILVCQMIPIKISNPGGEDFLCNTPELQTDPKANIAADYMDWVDHIFMVDHANVTAEGGKAVATGGRVIRVHPEIHFEAKSRTLGPEYATVAFEHNQDDSIWQFLFGGE